MAFLVELLLSLERVFLMFWRETEPQASTQIAKVVTQSIPSLPTRSLMITTVQEFLAVSATL